MQRHFLFFTKKRKKKKEGGGKEKNARAAYEGKRKDEQTEVQGKDKKWWVEGSSKDVVRVGEDEGMEDHRRRDGATEVGFLTDSWKGLCEAGAREMRDSQLHRWKRKGIHSLCLSQRDGNRLSYTCLYFPELEIFEAQFKFFHSLTTHLSIIQHAYVPRPQKMRMHLKRHTTLSRHTHTLHTLSIQSKSILAVHKDSDYLKWILIGLSHTNTHAHTFRLHPGIPGLKNTHTMCVSDCANNKQESRIFRMCSLTLLCVLTLEDGC